MRASCYGQVAMLRLAVISLSALILILLWHRPEAARMSIEKLSLSNDNNSQDAVQSDILEQHPIKTLSKKATHDFEQMLAQQSDSFEKAEAEYVRRYKRTPPAGFQKWFEYAKAENSLIIDEFDMIDRAITPFLQRRGIEIAGIVRKIAEKEAWSWSCKIENGRLQKSCGILGEEFMILFSDVRILGNLPTVQFILNGLDEPRILLKQQQPSQHSARLRLREDPDAEPIKWTELTHKIAWQPLVLDQCSTSNDSLTHADIRSADSRTTNSKTLGIPFLQDRANSMDLCQHPEYEHLHGLWEASANLQVTDQPLPILSPAVPSTMNDIPFPAMAYTQGGYSYSASELVDYSEKIPGLYWAGKTTGGYQTFAEENWVPLHRQRFVALANGIDQGPFTYLRRKTEGSTRWETVSRDDINKSSYHVHFTGIVQCEEAACKHQEEYFKVDKPDGRGESGKYTMVFDADGNGHSARYYRLLMSRSLPLKQTAFQEWHDDRLQPWLHFVPISLGMEELPEVVRYFAEEEEGRELAKELALKGREWSLKVLRPVDQVIYLYRLLLELARVQDPSREPIFR